MMGSKHGYAPVRALQGHSMEIEEARRILLEGVFGSPQSSGKNLYAAIRRSFIETDGLGGEARASSAVRKGREPPTLRRLMDPARHDSVSPRCVRPTPGCAR
jgi:hypothetical protein